MNDIWKNDKDFKQAIGGFIIAFSELEFGLVFLCTMTEFDIRKSNSYTSKYLGCINPLILGLNDVKGLTFLVNN
ncbi:MAG: hypothetical protein A2546_06535 [Sphingobacteriia bacterium RIFOXYD2_FULL_35_12]|nr:MAG: hypothetical protein A2491_18665 [Bacteroidetes bacterium RIFOXYC12_FULL_35_7]OHC84714.1 MAG: hypothetical protein A2472_10290 [Sphingobacteriia bacterium RIFOXYC2_FULL_35_18]OHC88853.1 MAG: hypothetical protein A2546_06535 [Sphingobacteriia bacterium RIFOXYD2_FULL_35_12]